MQAGLLFTVVVCGALGGLSRTAHRHNRARSGETCSPPQPMPVPVSLRAVDLPCDHYLHRSAPTEWYWHIGTLRTGTGRVFGFELTVSSFQFQKIGFTQTMVSDIESRVHHQRTTLYPQVSIPGQFGYDARTFAEHDVTEPFAVKLGTKGNFLTGIDVTNGGSGYTSPPNVIITGNAGSLGVGQATIDAGRVTGVVLLVSVGFISTPSVQLVGGGGSGATAVAVYSYVEMNAPWGQVAENMTASTSFQDESSHTTVAINLHFSQTSPAFIVWGRGRHEIPGLTGNQLQVRMYGVNVFLS